jgi:hypothetical protein
MMVEVEVTLDFGCGLISRFPVLPLKDTSDLERAKYWKIFGMSHALDPVLATTPASCKA